MICVWKFLKRFFAIGKKSGKILAFNIMKDKGFLNKMKETAEKLQCEREFQEFVEWNFQTEKQNIEDKKKQNIEIMKLFYSYAASTWENSEHPDFSIHFPGLNDQFKKKTLSYTLPQTLKFLYTFEANHFDLFINNLKNDKEIKNSLLPIFLSPLAINYFYNSFNDIIKQFLHSGEDINVVASRLLTNISVNMCFCPDYLIKFFQQDNVFFEEIGLSKQNIICEYVTKILFLCPDLFGIKLDNCTQLDNLKSNFNQIKSEFSDNFSFVFEQYNNAGFKILQTTNDEDEGVYDQSVIMNAAFDNSFRQLLKISPKFPDQLPKYLQSESYEKIIEALVLRPGPKFFKRNNIFQKMKNLYINETKSTKINQMYLNSLKQIGANINHESDAIAKLNQKSIQLSHIYHLTNEIFGIYSQKCFDLLKGKDLHPRDPSDYINCPQHFIDDIKMLKQEHQAEINTPINVFNFYIQNIKFDVFARRRKEIITTDRSLNTILQSYHFHKFDTYIQDLKNLDKRSYEKFVNKFDMAFSDSTDPLRKAMHISYAYSEIIGKIKSNLGKDVNKLEEDERQNFIFSVFCLMRPAKIMSVYVFLYEFVFNPVCIQIFNDANHQDELASIQQTRNILIDLFTFCSKLNLIYGINGDSPNYLYQAANLSRMSHKSVNLVVKKDESELEKLALMLDPNYNINDDGYEKVSESFGAKSRINYFKKIDTSQMITLYIYENEDNFHVCNVTFSDDSNIKLLPTKKEDMINLIKEEEKNNK